MPLFRDTTVSQPVDMEIYTDTSSTLSFGGYFKGKWFAESWPACLQATNSSDSHSIAFRDLYSIVFSSIMWRQFWIRKRISFLCDNLASVHIINKGRSKSANIAPLIRRLTLCAAKQNFVISVKHVPGVHNNIDDALSRLQITNAGSRSNAMQGSSTTGSYVELQDRQ